MKRVALLFAGLVTATAAQAADPVRIGLTTVLQRADPMTAGNQNNTARNWR